MTQGERVGRGGDVLNEAAVNALWPILACTCVDGSGTWSDHARVILDAIREGKVPGVSTVPAPSKCNIDDPCRICGEHHHPALSAGWHKETIAELRGKVASLEKDAADRCEALTIAHSMGFHSRNDEVRALQAKLAAAEADRDYWRNSFDGERAAKRTLVKMLESDISELQSKLATAERDEARGLQLKWIPCSERLPECKETCESMWGGTARSDTCLVLYADDPKHWDEPGPHISTGFLLDYSVGEENCFEWMYPIDRTGGLERCSSHGGPVPIAWMPLPEGTSP